ncbi:DUF11 domain-containing protein [Candidatus Dojkabacteria bacterium]|jgi:hypothetical protein|nr:DUF11 domain-containing protein [Candidatus Dojkabacteria bacterium]
MKNIRFRANKKTLVMLLVVFLILVGTGGFLLWRVNQQDTVAPTDSDAGGGGGNGSGIPCCCDSVKKSCDGISACKYKYVCKKEGICLAPKTCGGRDTGHSCNTDKDCETCAEYGCVKPGICKPSKVCSTNPNKSCRTDDECCEQGCIRKNTEECKFASSGGVCKHNRSISCGEDSDCCQEIEKILDSPVPKCTCTMLEGCCHNVNQCKTTPPGGTSRPDCPYNCVWPFVSWYFTGELEGTEKGCQCAPCDYDRPGAGPYCLDNAPTCNPGACPAGYQEHTYDWNCNAMMNGGLDRLNAFLRENGVPNPRLCGAGNNDKICVTECKAKCAGCNNEYKAYRYCVKETPAPTCGDGNLDPGEQCDPPGSTCANGQICSTDCTCPEPAPTCGDGNLDPGEECDPPGSTCTNGQTCNTDCKCPEPPRGPEVCDGVGKGDKIIFSNGREVDGKYIYNNHEEVQYEYVMGDSEGINLVPGEHYVKVKVGTTDIIGSRLHPQPTLTPSTGSPKKVTIQGKLNTSLQRLSPGIKPMSIFWKRVGETGAYSAACQAKRSFTINACDAVGAKWSILPPKKITVGKEIPFKYITGDTDGVDNASITVLLGEDSVSVTKKSLTNGMVEITGELSSLETGNYTLEIKWKDIYGAGNTTPCYAKAEFEVVERRVPDWDIDKVAAETCIDDRTENPKAKITNTITVTNNGDGVGGLKNIVDTLDTKVVGGTVTDISHGGVYANGKITWTFETGSELANYNPGQSKTFTYSYIVEKDKFGIYDNTAVATTAGDNTLEAGASIEARCNVVTPTCGDGKVDKDKGEQCDPPGSTCINAYGQESICTDLCACPGETPIPKTGLFDESENIVILGAVILFAGLGWTWISNTYSVVNGKLVQRRKEQFEQRVVKK